MKYILVILFLFQTTTLPLSDEFKLVTKIEVTADFITTDSQNNIYIVQGDKLSKYNQEGKLLYKYSNKTLGHISFVDVSNMLKPMLFYKEFLQVLYLDNTLSDNGQPIALDKIEFQQTQLACSSFNNSLWLYDQQNLELVRVNKNLEKTNATGNLGALLNISLHPNHLIEYNNKVYLNNPSTGIIIFDIYGTYYKTIPQQNVKHFQPVGDWVYYMTEKNKIESYHIKTSEIKRYNTPVEQFNSFRLEHDFLFLHTNKEVLIYKKNS